MPSAGQFVRSTDVIPGPSAFSTWSPTYANLTPGNAVVFGRYFQTGGLVMAWLTMTMGSTSTFVSSTFTFSLPVTPKSGYIQGTVLGSAFALDASAGTPSRRGGTVCISGGSNVFVVIDDVAGTTAGGSTPWVWTTSDVLSLHVCYEAN